MGQNAMRVFRPRPSNALKGTLLRLTVRIAVHDR